MQLTLRPEVEVQVRERLSAGVDANELILLALEAMAEGEAVGEAIELGWQQAEAGDFVKSSPESVMRRADRR